MSLNKWMFIGRVGSIVTHGGGNDKRVEVRLAVDAGYTDKDSGDWKDRTYWFTLTSFAPKTVERISTKYQKGDMVVSEGHVVPWSKGEGDDAKYGHNFAIDTFRFLTRPKNGNAGDDTQSS